MMNVSLRHAFLPAAVSRSVRRELVRQWQHNRRRSVCMLMLVGGAALGGGEVAGEVRGGRRDGATLDAGRATLRELGATPSFVVAPMGDLRSGGPTDAAALERLDERRHAIGEVGRLNKQSEAETNQMLGGLRNSSFMGDRERARSGDLAALQGLLGQMGGGMSKSDKMAASRLGYAGKPSSSYMDKQRSSYLGAFGAPIAQQIFGGLNQAAGGAAAERGQNISQQHLAASVAFSKNPLRAPLRFRSLGLGAYAFVPGHGE